MKAIIFDMDGVILDSEFHWKKAELTLFQKLLPSWTKADQQKIMGLNVHDTYRKLANDYGLSLAHMEFLSRVEGIALEVYRKKADLMPDFVEFIKNIKSKKIPTALASSSLRQWIDIALKRFEIEMYFDFVVSNEDLDVPGKPAPDIYLYTAKKLGIKPADCLVIEDSKNGVMAAKAAGMYCVGFRNGFNKKQDLSSADVEIEGFKNMNNDKFFQLFR
jgi:HAD superfamily hydrolase (TIGR01509 family)